MAGITEDGFVKKTLAEIKTEIEDRLKATFGIFINLLPGSVFQTLVGIQSERESLLWDLAEAVYNSRYPSSASGIHLDKAVEFNGLVRQAKTKTVVPTVYLFGDVGTTIPAGTQASILGNSDAKFITLSDVTLGAGVNEIQDIAVSAVATQGSFKLSYDGEETSAIAFDATAADIKAALEGLDKLTEVTVTGSIAAGLTIEFTGDDGLQPHPILLVVDNLLEDVSNDPVTLTVTEDTAGVAQGEVDMEAIEEGEVNAPLDTLTEIDTPVSGFNRLVNRVEAITGRDDETDADLRIRRELSISLGGNATVDSIRAKLLAVDGVRNAFVFENDTNATVSGRPANSFECVVDGGEAADIVQVIWNSKPAGIETYGALTAPVIDSMGITRNIKYSRPIEVNMYFSIDLEVNAATFPSDGADLVIEAIIEWGNKLGIGQDVIVYPQLVAAINDIPGILDMIVRVDSSAVSTTPNDPAVDDNIDIAPEEVPVFDASRANVNILP